MTFRHLSTSLALLTGLLHASPTLAAGALVGVSPSDHDGVTYRSSTAVLQRKAAQIESALQGRLRGQATVRRARFDYTHEASGSGFEVRGVLYGWENLLVESYRLADLGQAIHFADHDRDVSDARRLIEVRGRRVLVFSGSSMDEPDLVAAVRAQAWPKNAPRRVDALGLQDSMDDLRFAFSQEALAESQFLRSWLAQQRGMLSAYASMDPNAVLSSAGGTERLEGDGAIFTLGAQSLALYSSPAQERAYADFLASLGPPALVEGAPAPAGPSAGASSSAGLATALVAASPQPTVELLGADHHGKRVRVRVGDEVRLELRGNPSTGYQWGLAAPLVELREVASDYQVSGPGVGAGGVFRFSFRAERAGTEDLRLEYSRAWGGTADTFRVTIEVE